MAYMAYMAQMAQMAPQGKVRGALSCVRWRSVRKPGDDPSGAAVFVCSGTGVGWLGKTWG